ncbi:hypothetical protein GQX74_008314 [Glossina fuscipes]|nr:hypothetical protein GQX74_008314 [Glossina fuscipes]
MNTKITDVCRNHFKVRESDLFDANMLYDLTNFHRVLITLSKLSQCAKVQQLHPKLEGFNLQLSPSERSHSDEDIYKDLHSTDIKKSDSFDTSSEYFDHISQNGSLSVEDENSDITNENGTENTEDYIEDTVSVLSETIDDEKPPVQNTGSLPSTTTTTITTTTNKITGKVSNAPPLGLSTRSASSSGMGNLDFNSSHDSNNQQLQKVAATVYNYQQIDAEDMGHEYLNAIYSEEDEKVYEDLCYVTFSTHKVAEMNHALFKI